jgi:hypothetical protein
MIGDDVTNNGKPKTSSTSVSTASPINSVEAFKDSIEACHRNAHSVVDDFNNNL